MLLLGIDFETTSVEVHDPGFRVIEVGMAVWNTEVRSVVECFSTVIRVDLIPQKISGLTGITTDLTQDGSNSFESCMGTAFNALLRNCRHLVAHNHFFEKEVMERYKIDLWQDIVWIDTMTDIMYPDWMGARNLVQLASLHRIMNPSPHRALNDVLVMFDILGQYNFDDVLAIATTPFVNIIAKVSYDDRNLAKNRGFRWDPVAKVWYKTIREFLLRKEEQEYEFEVEINTVND